MFLTFLITKSSSHKLEAKPFGKTTFIFWYSNMITNLKFRIFFITYILSKSVYMFVFTTLIVLWYVLLYLLTMWTNLSICTFLIQTSYACKFWMFQQQWIFLHYVLNAFLYHYLVTMISLIYWKMCCLYLPRFCLAYVQIHLIFL